MGACASCLGRTHDRDLLEDDEQSRLLFDDVHANQYGSFGDQNISVAQADPQEVQRETEALQKVVAQTSNHLVDIFTMAPQNTTSAPAVAFPAPDARILRYQDVLAKLSQRGYPSNTARHVSADSTPNISDGWISEGDEAEEIKGHALSKSEAVGPLLGGFDADGVD